MNRAVSTNRAAVIMSAAALITSIGIAGGPAIASIVANSDKVDGLHAVKASASKAQRKGKLVATDPTTGLLPSGAIGNDIRYPGVIPPGATNRGAFGFDVQSAGTTGDYGGAIDFGGRLPGEPIVEYSPTGTSTTHCPGTVDQPEANPGYLCVYYLQSAGVAPLVAWNARTTTWGSYYDYQTNAADGADVFVRGTWAVTAPVSVVIRPSTGRAGDNK
jgi:hypothetical protein